jgi:hypothetical protein
VVVVASDAPADSAEVAASAPAASAEGVDRRREHENTSSNIMVELEEAKSAKKRAEKIGQKVSAELEQRIEKLMDLMAHKNFDRDLGKMFEILVDAELRRYEKKTEKDQENDKANEKTRETRKCEETLKEQDTEKLESRHSANKELREGTDAEPSRRVRSRNRYIPRETRRLVWAKYKGECSYKDPFSGKKCESKHAVQVDHKLALAKGGDHRPENPALLCSGHNSWKGARQVE